MKAVRSVVVVSLAGLIALALLTSGAQAIVKMVPATKMFTGTDKQAGKLVLADWTAFDGVFCLTQTSDGTPLFQSDAASVEPGASLKIRFDKEQKPARLVIRKWTKLDGAKPVGTGDAVPFALTKKLHQDRRVWIATLDTQVKDHLYLKVKGVWNDTSPCDGTQKATWFFHAKAA